MLEQPNQHCADETAVLTFFVGHFICGANEKQLAILTVHFFIFALATKQMHVGLGLPGAKPRASAGATRATLFSVNAVVESEFFFKVKRFVFAFFVLVADHIVRTRNYATGTSRAKTSVDDFFVEFFPLVCPTFGNFDHFASLVSEPKFSLTQVDLRHRKRQQ